MRTLAGLPTSDGTHHIRSNVVWRSDEMSRMGEEEWKRMEEMGVRVMCDMRRRDERDAHPVTVPVGVNIDVKWWSFDDAAIEVCVNVCVCMREREGERSRERVWVREKRRERVSQIHLTFSLSLSLSFLSFSFRFPSSNMCSIDRR